MPPCLQHYAGDLVATIPAGVTLADANRELARGGQWLPLDPPYPDRTTIGAIVGTNASGPRRHKYGAPRDLIIGIEVVLADGRAVKAGGRVVKNVAGYDLSRLFCGAHGSLGTITSATFKLSPIAAASQTVVATLPRIERALELAALIAAEPLTPSAIEVTAPAPRLLVRFETTARAAAQMASRVGALLESHGASIEMAQSEREQAVWQEHDDLVWGEPGTMVKVSTLPSELSKVVAVLEQSGAGTAWSLAGRAAVGVLVVRLTGAPAQTIATIKNLRQAAGREGHVTLLVSSDDIRAATVEPIESGLHALMAAVKARFDPQGQLPALP